MTRHHSLAARRTRRLRHWEALLWAFGISGMLTPYAVVAWKQREV